MNPTSVAPDPIVPPSLRTVRPEVVDAYVVAQEARLNVALKQASQRMSSFHQNPLTIHRLVQTFEAAGNAQPRAEVQQLVAKAIESLYQADVAQHGARTGGERLVSDGGLKSTLGRFKGESLTSLMFLAHHPLLKHPKSPGALAALTADAGIAHHALNVSAALDRMDALASSLVNEPSTVHGPDAARDARRMRNASTAVRETPRCAEVLALLDRARLPSPSQPRVGTSPSTP